VPVYFGDPIVRRAASLQRTRDAFARAWWVAARAEVGVKAGERVRVRQGDGERSSSRIDERLPPACEARGRAPSHRGLGSMFGPVSLERA